VRRHRLRVRVSWHRSHNIASELVHKAADDPVIVMVNALVTGGCASATFLHRIPHK
jgi:hypothetical protein